MNVSASQSAASASKANGTTSSTSAASGLSDQFMEILLAQLRNQNPLEPMNDKDMIAQMTQINSLMELQKINSSLEKLIALGQTEQEQEEEAASEEAV